MANYRNAPEECSKIQYSICGEVKKRVIELQKEHFAKTGQPLAYARAITKLILEK